MTPEQFISKWKAAELTERAAAQSHFNDLCALLGEPTPADADPLGEWYAFERGAAKTTGADGWADVWKRHHFAWEYKGKRKDLTAAFVQLQQYALALENPPLLVVSDLERFEIHTNWTNSVSEVHEIRLEQLRDFDARQKLKWVMSDPERLRPGKTRQGLTEDAAAEFAKLAQRLRERGYQSEQVAHFVNRLVFCMFAEDVDLLPNKMFKRMLEHALSRPDEFQALASDLFKAMKGGGRVGFEHVQWFNGGLFDDDLALHLAKEDIETALRAANLDWAEIDPSILGTLFERGLDPDKRSQLGAHYTDRDKIMLLVAPMIVRPWLARWSDEKRAIEAYMVKAAEQLQSALAEASGYPELNDEVTEIRGRRFGRSQLELFPEAPKQRRRRDLDELKKRIRSADGAFAQAVKDADQRFRAFLSDLRSFRVLDPACGSGNFLYLSLLALKDIEHLASIEAERLGLPRQFPQIGPASVKGLEINQYAAELARVSVWIGEIQWMRRNGFGVANDPILKPLTNIERRDAIINHDGTASVWPEADVAIGNPPYLGAKLMKRKLGADQTEVIRKLYEGRLPGFTDLVCYWFENARELIESGKLKRAGFVGTNSIRKNTNLPVMRRIAATTRIFEAWSEEKWTVDGAAVDVSLICFGASETNLPAGLDGKEVDAINPDLTFGLDLTRAAALRENRNAAFLGIQKSGPFDVPGEVARQWLVEPINPNGRANAEVLRPYWNGDDLTGRPRDMWFIDLPLGLSKAEAALFVRPFEHLATTLDDNGKLLSELREALGERAGPRWWEPHWPRPEMRSRITPLKRYIVTPETAQHRLFVWLSYPVLPDKNLIVIPREDDLMFGLLQNRFHAAWALRKGSDLQDRPRYTHTTTFATFPFPQGMTPDVPVIEQQRHGAAPAIAKAARRLDELRTAFLYPEDLIKEIPEVALGFPSRKVPRDEAAAQHLAARTLTDLYNEPPIWLTEAHRALDTAVAGAYGWPANISDEDALGHLFEMNQGRGDEG